MKFFNILIVLLCSHSLFAGPKEIPIQTAKPDSNKVYPIAIIGAGAAGTMAVQRAVLNNTEVLLFTGAKREQKNSCGYWVRKVDNVPGLGKYERTLLEVRNEVLKDLYESEFRHRLFVIEGSVCSLEKHEDVFKLVDGCGATYYAKFVVLATGMMKEQPLIQSSIKPILAYANGQKVGYCCMCDGHRCYHKKVAVIGHGEMAVDMAALIASKYEPQSMVILTNGNVPEFDETSVPVLTDPIAKVLGDEEEKVLQGFQLESGMTVEADICFVALGIRPNNQLAIQLGAQLSDAGLVITDETGETSVSNLFVIGDLRAGSYKQIYTAWQHAVDAIQEIELRTRL